MKNNIWKVKILTISEKVSYLKGLTEGLEIDDKSKEGKIILAIIDVLEDMAVSVTDLEGDYDELSEYIELIDEDLEEVENALYDDEDDECTFICPSCGEEITLEEEDFEEDELICPVCGEKIEFEDICEDECTCGSSKEE